MATYNGHKNWNHWNVSLWINNDEGLYRLARECIKEAGNRDAAAEMMIERLAEMNLFITPDGARYTKTTVRAAMVGL